MPNIPGFSEPDSNKRFLNEQEGFGRVLSHVGDEMPRCSSVPVSWGAWSSDFRGPIPNDGLTQKNTDRFEWETTPAQNQDDCTFCFIMNTLVYPEFRPAYPYVTATLEVDDTISIPVPMAYPRNFQTTKDGVCLYFEPRRFSSMAESYHRSWNPNGVSGIYRVTVPAAMITKGKPVKLKFSLDKTEADIVTFAALAPRSDVLALSLATLRDELTQVQNDVVELKLAYAMLAAKNYTELFPKYLKAERGVAVVEETGHILPPVPCLYDGDNILLTYRRGAEHVSPDGACWGVRSFDKGKTFTKPKKLFDLGNHDHRNTPLIQISNGDLVGADYRLPNGYDENGRFSEQMVRSNPTLWGVWSEDRGETWHFTEKPITPEGTEFPLAEMERPAIELPNGRLLLAACYFKKMIGERLYGDDEGPQHAMGVWCSDDRGRNWKFYGTTESYDGAQRPRIEGEPTIIRCLSGKLVMLIRSEFMPVTDWNNKGMLLQSDSFDEGRTWSKPRPTMMPSMSTPAHLTLLADGRLLATHSSRGYPCSIYLTVSDDEGETWKTDNTKIVTQDLVCYDATYPVSVQFSDGSLLTTWYNSRFGKSHIGTARYNYTDLD